MTCLYIHPPVHYPAPSLSDHLLWGVLEWILKWILNFHPWRFLMKKRLKHRTNTQCGWCVKLVLSMTCGDGLQHLMLTEKAQVSKETLFEEFFILFNIHWATCYSFLPHEPVACFYFQLLLFKQRSRVHKALGTFDFYPLMFLSYLLNQAFRKMGELSIISN